MTGQALPEVAPPVTCAAAQAGYGGRTGQWSTVNRMTPTAPIPYSYRLPTTDYRLIDGEVAEWSKALPWLKGVRVNSPSRV